MAAVAPLLCAGITTYSPLRYWKVGAGQKVGIVGLGGLGHMAVKFAKAFGAHVVLRSEEHTSELQSLMRISFAVFCLKKKIINILAKYLTLAYYIYTTYNSSN